MYKFPGHKHFLKIAESGQTDPATLNTARKQRAVLECGELLAQAVDAPQENKKAILEAALKVSEGMNIAKRAVDLMVKEVRSELFPESLESKAADEAVKPKKMTGK